MRRLLLPLVVVTLLFVESSAADSEAKPWLDLQGCAICKHMGAHMDMMQHVTWETHKTANGMLSASVVPEKYQAKMDEVHQEMMKTAAQLEKGKKLSLCGFCTSYGELQAAGAKSEEIKTDFGMIHLMTSDDPEVIKQIHEHADRTVKEYKAYVESQQE